MFLEDILFSDYMFFKSDSNSSLLCWSFFIVFDQGSLTELFCCSLVILCSELFVSLFFLLVYFLLVYSSYWAYVVVSKATTFAQAVQHNKSSLQISFLLHKKEYCFGV